MTQSALVKNILSFWFGSQDHAGLHLDKVRLWFAGEGAELEHTCVSSYVERHFMLQIRSASSGGLADWQQSAHGRLALILLLDQFPRLLANGQPPSTVSRGYALRYCKAGIRAGVEGILSPAELFNFYAPLLFSVNLAERQRGIRLLEQLLEKTHAPDHEHHSQLGLVQHSLFMAVQYDVAARCQADMRATTFRA